jgi:hypothetical protein
MLGTRRAWDAGAGDTRHADLPWPRARVYPRPGCTRDLGVPGPGSIRALREHPDTRDSHVPKYARASVIQGLRLTRDLGMPGTRAAGLGYIRAPGIPRIRAGSGLGYTRGSGMFGTRVYLGSGYARAPGIRMAGARPHAAAWHIRNRGPVYSWSPGIPRLRAHPGSNYNRGSDILGALIYPGSVIPVDPLILAVQSYPGL